MPNGSRSAQWISTAARRSSSRGSGSRPASSTRPVRSGRNGPLAQPFEEPLALAANRLADDDQAQIRSSRGHQRDRVECEFGSLSTARSAPRSTTDGGIAGSPGVNAVRSTPGWMTWTPIVPAGRGPRQRCGRARRRGPPAARPAAPRPRSPAPAADRCGRRRAVRPAAPRPVPAATAYPRRRRRRRRGRGPGPPVSRPCNARRAACPARSRAERRSSRLRAGGDNTGIPAARAASASGPAGQVSTAAGANRPGSVQQQPLRAPRAPRSTTRRGRSRARRYP